MSRYPRVPNWSVLLHARLREVRDTPFTWGKHDCFSFACDLIHVQTGFDPIEYWRDDYHDLFTGIQLLRDYMGDTTGQHYEGDIVERAWCKLADDVGFERVSYAQAQRGDVALIRHELPPLKSSIAVCFGEQVAVVDWKGVKLVPARSASLFWKI